MNFTDRVEMDLKAGRGGDGKLSFRHEKFRAKGGPDGGDGGNGGDIIVQADHNVDTLSHFRTKRKIAAGDGQTGGDNRKHGKSAEDVILRVPVGTVVMEGEKV